MPESQDIESATTQTIHDGRPDQKTRRYDRQLRLWAASGQAALENSRLLVISGSATSTSILKNLVLPGIGHFTILDHNLVTPQDAGNNFFLEGPSSIGKPRASEAARLLAELNDGVESHYDTRKLEDVLDQNPEWLTGFTLVIAHNLEKRLLDRLADLLWNDQAYPPLVVVRSAGFIAEFYIQFHEHHIIESHSDTAPSLRIDRPFPALLEHALSLDLENMDPTDHGHIPYVVILVRALEDWKKSHDGKPPQNSQEKSEFKNYLASLKHKPDEENFDEALAQAYRVWTQSTVPSDIASLFSDPLLPQEPSQLTASSPPFYHLLLALKQFTSLPPYTLPLTSTLPDMKADTDKYVHLQRLYKQRAEEEKQAVKELLDWNKASAVGVNEEMLDSFVRNSHGLRLLRGKKWGVVDSDREALANASDISGKQLAIHLSLSALFNFFAKHPGIPPSVETLTAEAQAILPPNSQLPEEWEAIVGEIARAPTADLPNTAAFLGGLVAQEVIKMITKQYVPINGYCCADLVETWTGVL
ncbi:hypothetical protein AX16_005094 [Volvariella volvacea WC 439]|nr:hypothetical protein AX16_005094 [Volvariella volvacea WC 439]